MPLHDYTFTPGQVIYEIEILLTLRRGVTRGEDLYWCRMLCCGTFREITHTQIIERRRRRNRLQFTMGCKDCTDPLALRTWEPPPGSQLIPYQFPVVADPWQPGDRHGTVVLVASVHPQGRKWLIQWDCCGDEQVITREYINNIASKARRGLEPCCRRCARERAIVHEQERRQQLPPPGAPGALVAANLLPKGVIGAEKIWPRPPSLAGQPPYGDGPGLIAGE